MILTIQGNIPNKKDNLRPRKGGGMYYEGKDRRALDGIVFQLQTQWKGPPLECAEVTVWLFRKSARFDPDGQKATILDALKQAGVIVDDNAARSPDSIVRSRRAFSRAEECTEIQVHAMDSPWPQRKRKAREILRKSSEKA